MSTCGPSRLLLGHAVLGHAVLGHAALGAAVLGAAVAGALVSGCAGGGAVAGGPAAGGSTVTGGTSSGVPATAGTSSGAVPGAPSPNPPEAPARPSATVSTSGSPIPVISSARVLRPGDKGWQVLAVQQRLSALGYWLGPTDGRYGDLTRQAVLALQKSAGLPRDGVVGARTRAALNAGIRPRARSTSGHVIEIDLTRQVLLVVDGGRVNRIINTSTGSGAWYTAPDGTRARADTPVGVFRTIWEVNGWRVSPLGQLYRPKYFHLRGIAIHGYTSVPALPASHGCVRVSTPAMDMFWSSRLIPPRTWVMVHR